MAPVPPILGYATQWHSQKFSMEGGEGVEILRRILTSMLSLMTRLCKVIHTFVSEERKLYHNYSISFIYLPQKLIARYSILVLTVPRAGDRSFVTGSIHGGSRSRLRDTASHPGFGKEGGHHRGFGGVAPSSQQIFAIFT